MSALIVHEANMQNQGEALPDTPYFKKHGRQRGRHKYTPGVRAPPGPAHSAVSVHHSRLPARLPLQPPARGSGTAHRQTQGPSACSM
eukprot:1158262-Pelagomonas_calceolata.AAC.7